MNAFSRLCPCCGVELFYANKSNRDNAEKNKAFCRRCSKKHTEKKFTRICPECKKEIYHTREHDRDKAKEKNSVCAKCSVKKVNDDLKGKNPFLGKHHTEETKQILREKMIINYDKIHTEEIREKQRIAATGKNNNMYGKSVFDVWVEKYGYEEAVRKKEILREKQRINSCGEKNPMYGKPAPEGSGSGIGGWYNEFYFRSLHELSYILNVLEKENLKWETAEKKPLSICYISETGVERTYRADFLVENNNRLVEVKPVALMKTKNNILKQKAAEIFCLNKGWSYEVVNPPYIDNKILLDLYLKKQLKFSEKNEKKFLKLFLKDKCCEI